MNVGNRSPSPSSQEKDYEKRGAYPATDDVEAAPSTDEEDLYGDDEPGRFAEKWNAFRASRSYIIIRDFTMIAVLVSTRPLRWNAC